MKRLILVLMLLPCLAMGQNGNAEGIIKQAKLEYEKIKDYQVDAVIKLDLDIVKMPVKKAKIYFKRPNKIKIDAKGFIMMHKKTMNYNIDEFLNGGYTSIYIKTEQVDGALTHVVKILPKDDKTDNILTTLWIDAQLFCIRKIENNSKSAGSFSVNLKYATNPMNLPSKMIVSFSAGKNQGLQMAADMQGMGENKDKKTKKGTATIEYSNYIVNKGISDAIFSK